MEKKSILIADDDPITLRILEKILTDKGYVVTKASNGKEALRSAKTQFLDLIILDIDMPLLDGTQVQEHLKENSITKNIPIIFLTGMLLKKEEACLGKQVGQSFLMAKPIDAEVLLEEIKKRI
ncbi:MAG: response regulator [Candidatus Omnitrophica bacterium]|nr:response regulator [Candidatus Omnitrophota bacterium]